MQGGGLEGLKQVRLIININWLIKRDDSSTKTVVHDDSVLEKPLAF